MKRIVLIAALLLAYAAAHSQNIQLHYDLGHTLNGNLSGRPSVTTTVEMFKPDRWGSMFMFADIDYFHDGVAGAYWEVSRELNIGKDSPWAAHVEYNGGTSSSQVTNVSTRFQHAILAGPAWNWHSADFSRTLSLQAMFKYYFKGQNPWNKAFSSFQATAVWGIQMAKGLCTFSGFLDCWYDPNVQGKWILLSEPQFWVNLNHMKGMEDFNLSLGTEVEISNNFVWNDQGQNNRFYAIPTLAAKWSF
ncbi:MAG: DUF5020 family protein [Prevotella sp.]|nr:DUF5020 family protein [Prevotella sp.]